jgi:hypothetical protein
MQAVACNENAVGRLEFTARFALRKTTIGERGRALVAMVNSEKRGFEK